MSDDVVPVSVALSVASRYALPAVAAVIGESGFEA